MIGTWQLVLIFAIVLVLFGAGRIPKIMKDLGTGFRAFKNGIEGIDGNDDILTNSKISTNRQKTIRKTRKTKSLKTTTKKKKKTT